MYTTLSQIKAFNACKPGYARQLSFFGRTDAVREQKIPLHVIALLGGSEDLNWVLENAVIIDRDEFMALKRRTIPWVWAALCAKFEERWVRDNRITKSRSAGGRSGRFEPLLPTLMQALSLTDPDEILNFIEEHRWCYRDHDFYKHFVSNAALTQPVQYLQFLSSCISRNLETNTVLGRTHYNARARLDGRPEIPEKAGTYTIGITDDEDEPDEDEPDEDEEPRAPARGRVPAATRASITSVPAVKKLVFPARFRVFASYDSAMTEGQNLAHAFCTTPYAFLADLDYKLPPGVSIKDGKIVLELDRNKEGFAVLKLLNGRTEIPDQL